MPTFPEQKRAAEKFASEWLNRTGYEKGETATFWIQLLREVFGLADAEKHIIFEDRVQIEHTNFIDARIPKSRVLIEQKSADIDLDAKQKQSDGALLTPLQQAQRYVLGLPLSAHPRYIVVCNFLNFQIHDCETRETDIIPLAEFPKNHSRMAFLITPPPNERIARETEISKAAGELIGELYDELIKRYTDPQSDETLAALNVLCVRLAFCLYAEDAGIFGKADMFEQYIRPLEPRQIRRALNELFKILDTPVPARDKYLAEDDPALAAFPYVNGGLFARPTEIPPFDEAAKQMLLRAANFNWIEISPTIFGAIFESTLNPVTRRTGGMHYTSIQNIHKVIDPLFLDELRAEFEKIKRIPVAKTRGNALRGFQNKIASLKFLDPACGSGNFLTESFIALRRLENEIIAELHGSDTQFSFVADELIKVTIHQFYGIEINDFAVTVAKTALWIAESQMLAETEKIIDRDIDFLPLKSYANIAEGNALRLDWSTLRVSQNLGEFNFDVPATPVPENIVPVQYDFIMGNPPFSGARVMTAENKADLLDIFGKNWKNAGNLDFVSAWFKKAHDFIAGTPTRAALVATNSICQGESVANLWKPLFENGFHIDFAYRTFRWDSESDLMAHVHCVIIGFSCGNANPRERLIFNNGKEKPVSAKNINAYLMDAPNVFVENRKKPICAVPEMGIGNKPIDGGNYLFTTEEKIEFLKKEPAAEKYFKRWLGAEEFLNARERWCLWLGDCPPNELRAMKHCYQRVQNVRELRLASKSAGTRKIANKPTRFHVENMPAGTYILVPSVSSERRKYVPMGFFDAGTLASNLVLIIPAGTLFHFGVLESRIHMAWMRAVCGRLKSDYRYSASIVYNNFIWPKVDARSREKIEHTAQAILDARALFPNCSLADLYDELMMPPQLRHAHEANDRAVMEAYGFDVKTATESRCVAELMKMYKNLATEN